ncbi:hypothetical protein H0H93_004695 [Arthromyces matolae]|nr:hypothetical protein H0H93_004695 [Arthromyces matolae]
MPLVQHHVDAISLNAKLERRNMTTWAPQHPQAQPVIQPHYGHYPSSYPQNPSAHPGILPPPGGYYYGPHTGYYNSSSHPHQPAAQPVIPTEFHGHHIGHSSHQAGHDSSSRPVPLWLTSGTWPTSRIAGYLSDLENPDPPAWYKEWFIAPSLRNPAVPAVHPMPPWVYQHPPWTFDRIAFKLQELKRRAATELPPQWYLAYFQSIHSQPFYGNVGYHEHPSAYSNPYWPSIPYQPSHGNMENDQPPPPYSPAHEMPASSSISDVGHSHAATLAPPGYEARDAMTIDP